MPIHVLPDQVASQIAAGEVVERPASVVKELIENAIDAGATAIQVEIRDGGRQLIQVADNGCGIPAHEAETAFLRHATSKLSTANDLAAIGTLGFRGEALAAIAAVSQVTLVTRTADEEGGTRLTLEGGRMTSRQTAGAPLGTVISVEQLFYNVPPRLKFLKSHTTEKRLIDEFISRYALAYPEVRFRLVHDGRVTFQSSGNGGRREVLTEMHGPETARELLEINQEQGAGILAVSGFVGPPSRHWGNRTQINLFVNGRWIRDNSLTYAVIQAYHTLLPTGRYPMAVLFLRLPPNQVDVNVHPTKAEVRFRDANAAFATVQRAVRETLVSGSPVRPASHFASASTPDWSGKLDWNAFAHSDNNELDLDWDQPAASTTLDVQTSQRSNVQTLLGGERLPIMRVVGQVGAAYIITEGPDGMFLIDQHAAHERILYEQFMAAHQDESIPSQGLVAGAAVHLTPSGAGLLEENLPLLDQLGFKIDSFGPNAFMIRAMPALAGRRDPGQLLQEVVEELERGEAPLQDSIEAQIILRVCKTAAVKAGQTLSRQEMEAMIRQLEGCQNPHTCPHGRPTLIHLSVAQLAKEFGRI